MGVKYFPSALASVRGFKLEKMEARERLGKAGSCSTVIACLISRRVLGFGALLIHTDDTIPKLPKDSWPCQLAFVINVVYLTTQMRDTSTFNTVAHLRKILQKTQEDFAFLVGVSRNAIASLESGQRLKLSARLANKISEQTNVNPHWLLTAEPRTPMVNCDNQTWQQEDFEAAQRDLRERDLAVELYEREMAMEVGTAYILLQRALQAASKRNAFAVSQFRHRLEHFIRSEIHQFGELRDEVYRELREWNERYVGTGRTFPKTFLFPRDKRALEQGRREFEAMIEWLKEWEKRTKTKNPDPKRDARKSAPSRLRKGKKRLKSD